MGSRCSCRARLRGHPPPQMPAGSRWIGPVLRRPGERPGLRMRVCASSFRTSFSMREPRAPVVLSPANRSRGLLNIIRLTDRLVRKLAHFGCQIAGPGSAGSPGAESVSGAHNCEGAIRLRASTASGRLERPPSDANCLPIPPIRQFVRQFAPIRANSYSLLYSLQGWSIILRVRASGNRSDVEPAQWVCCLFERGTPWGISAAQHCAVSCYYSCP